MTKSGCFQLKKPSVIEFTDVKTFAGHENFTSQMNSKLPEPATGMPVTGQYVQMDDKTFSTKNPLGYLNRYPPAGTTTTHSSSLGSVSIFMTPLRLLLMLKQSAFLCYMPCFHLPAPNIAFEVISDHQLSAHSQRARMHMIILTSTQRQCRGSNLLPSTRLPIHQVHLLLDHPTRIQPLQP